MSAPPPTTWWVKIRLPLICSELVEIWVAVTLPVKLPLPFTLKPFLAVSVPETVAAPDKLRVDA